jgi:tripartite-type tricarboxylate transporter receptor subunit TctC
MRAFGYQFNFGVTDMAYCNDRRKLILGALQLGAGTLFTTHAQANKKPIRIITSSTPGGVPELSARELARRMAVDLDHPIYIEPKPGGFGAIWANELKRAAPDGFTLGATFMAMHCIFPLVRKPSPFDPIKDFASIGTWTEGAFVLCASSQSGITSVAQVVEQAPKTPKQISFGVVGVASPGSLLMELFMKRTNIKLLQVNYKPNELTLAAARGEIDLVIDGTQQLVPWIENKQLIPLAVFSDKRLPRLPDIPTVVEAGVKTTAGLSQLIWHGLVGPVGLPDEVVQRFAMSIQRVCSQPDFIKWNEGAGRVMNYTSPRQMTIRVQDELRIWSEVVDSAGIRLEG